MWFKAPLFLVVMVYGHLTPARAVPAPLHLTDHTQMIEVIQSLHLPQSPIEWGIFLGSALAFFFLRRSDKRVIQRTVSRHVRAAVAAAIAPTPSPLLVALVPEPLPVVAVPLPDAIV